MMKSTQATRDALHSRLTSALSNNPNNKELKEALDVVDDILKYHKQLVKKRSLYIVYDPEINTMYFYNPVNMELLGNFVFDGNYDDDDQELGILLQKYL